MSNLYILEFKSAKDINALKRLKEKTIVYYAKIFKNSNSSASYSIEIEKLKELISKINFNINDLENEKKEKNKNLKNMKLSNEDSLKEEKTRIKIKPTENNKLIVLKKKLNDMNKHIINIILKMRIVGNLKEDIKKFVIDLINSFKKNDDIDGNITLFTNFLNKVSDFRDQIQLFQENNVDNFDFINISIDKFKKIILNFNNNISTEKKKQEISLKRKNSIDSIPDLSYSDNEDINLTKNNGFNEKSERFF